MKHKFLFFSLFWFLLGGLSYADDSERAPLESNIHRGQLENGFTYYIVHNELPPERVYMQLLVNAGAMNEYPEQNGLAHFCEHMAFNGTKHFPDKALKNYLESYGMSFGGGFNAYTSRERTVYILNAIPTDNEKLIDSCLLIMHDWASEVTYSDKEIDLERGVIREEWRLYGGANRRMNDSTNPIFYNNSRYAEHNIIGKLDVIDHAEYKLFRDFYRDWYRPDNQALVVAGDIDIKEMEKKIKKLFGKIPQPKEPMREIDYSVPENDGMTVAVASDKEANRYFIRYSIRQPGNRNYNIAHIKEDIVNNLYSRMLWTRFDELRKSPEPPFISAGGYYGKFSKDIDAFNVYINPMDDNPLKSLEESMKVLEQVRKYGFTEGELMRAKEGLLAGYEKSFKEKDKRKSRQYIRQCVQHFLEGYQSPGPEYYYQVAKDYLPEVDLELVNSKNNVYFKDNFQSLLIHAPEKEGVIIPSEEELRNTLKLVASSDITPYIDDVSDAPLVAHEPEGGEIVKWKNLEEIDATLWELSNGAKVVWKYTENKDDEIKLSAYSPGGSSHVENTGIPSLYTRDGVDAGGLGEFSQTQLNKKLTGKIAWVNRWISEKEEGFSGGSSVEDFETMMKLLYLKCTETRIDTGAWEGYMKRRIASVKNREASPNSTFWDSVQLVTNNYHPRVPRYSAELLKKADYQNALDIMEDRFLDAASFTFVFVGNIDTTTMKPIVEKYIGALPSSDRIEHAYDRGVRPPYGKVVKHFTREMKEPKGYSYIQYSSYLPYNVTNKFRIGALQYIIRRRCVDQVREEAGGTYGVGVRAHIDDFPMGKANFVANYNCDPERVHDLNKIIYSIIEDFKTNGPTDEEIQVAKEYYLKKKQENLKNNSYIMYLINNYLKEGYNPADEAYYENQIELITKESLQEIANKLFKKNVIEIVMVPPNEQK